MGISRPFIGVPSVIKGVTFADVVVVAAVLSIAIFCFMTRRLTFMADNGLSVPTVPTVVVGFWTKSAALCCFVLFISPVPISIVGVLTRVRSSLVILSFGEIFRCSFLVLWCSSRCASRCISLITDRLCPCFIKELCVNVSCKVLSSIRVSSLITWWSGLGCLGLFLSPCKSGGRLGLVTLAPVCPGRSLRPIVPAIASLPLSVRWTLSARYPSFTPPFCRWNRSCWLAKWTFKSLHNDCSAALRLLIASPAWLGSNRGGMLHTVTCIATDFAVTISSLKSVTIELMSGLDAAQLLPPHMSMIFPYLMVLLSDFSFSSLWMSQTFAPRRHTTSVFIIRFSSIFRIRLEPISKVLLLDWRSCARWFSYTRRVFSLVSAVICSRKTAFSVFSEETSFTAASRSCWVSLSVRVNKVTALSISDDKESSFSFVVRRSSPRCRHTKHDQKPNVSSFDISRHLMWYQAMHRQHLTMSPPPRPFLCLHPGMQWGPSGWFVDWEWDRWLREAPALGAAFVGLSVVVSSPWTDADRSSWLGDEVPSWLGDEVPSWSIRGTAPSTCSLVSVGVGCELASASPEAAADCSLASRSFLRISMRGWLQISACCQHI